jgi:hypothetical protein
MGFFMNWYTSSYGTYKLSKLSKLSKLLVS